MSIALEFDLRGLDSIAARIAELQKLDRDTLAEEIGAEVESQTRRRLSEEKTDPDNQAWPEWSSAYAKTRQSGHSLLESGGDLINSIQSITQEDQVETGSNLVYAGIHNEGGDIKFKRGHSITMPQRQYLGFSAENKQDINALVLDFLNDQLRAL
jgi:phage virion morphogenesis protein